MSNANVASLNSCMYTLLINFLSFLLSLSIHRIQQTRSGWPSNVFIFHVLSLSRPPLKMQQGIRTLKQTCNVAMIALYVRQVW